MNYQHKKQTQNSTIHTTHTSHFPSTTNGGWGKGPPSLKTKNPPKIPRVTTLTYTTRQHHSPDLITAPFPMVQQRIVAVQEVSGKCSATHARYVFNASIQLRPVRCGGLSLLFALVHFGHGPSWVLVCLLCVFRTEPEILSTKFAGALSIFVLCGCFFVDVIAKWDLKCCATFALRIQSFVNQIQPFTYRIQPFTNQIQPITDQIQPTDFFNLT